VLLYSAVIRHITKAKMVLARGLDGVLLAGIGFLLHRIERCRVIRVIGDAVSN
jgi:hypothetical protein